MNGDGKKVAGGRIVLEAWCEKGRCKEDKSTESGFAENAKGQVIVDFGKDSKGDVVTLSQFIADHEDWRSELGGHQGGEGQINLFGIQFNYAKGSFWDKLAEAYAGTHDTLNSPIWYDKLGNSRNLDGSLVGNIGEITNMTNVVIATPFALSVLLPPEVWSTINALANTK